MKRVSAIILCICLALSLCVTAGAQEKQHDYSTSVNSGIRHEVCTTLLGTRADEYYTGSYTYENLSAQSGGQLLGTLRTLMTSTHSKKSTYADCRDMAVKTDCENGDGKSISLIYTSYSATWNDWTNNRNQGWNREHVWPKALGNLNTNTAGAGTDLHHIRPSDQPVNSARGNKLYGEVNGGTAAKGASYTGNALGGYYSTYFEPLDNAKGDVARICLYVYVRYGGENAMCNDIYNVFEDVDVLLAWCELDPVDTWEMGRNEVVAAYQGNRNVFIDYPELAWLLFDEEVPSGMTTPSGSAAGSSSTPACSHSNTELRGAKTETCGADGYTGDTYCLDCGKVIKSGSGIQATGRHAYGEWTVTQAATTTAEGSQQRTCGECGKVQTQVIPKLEAPETPTTGTVPTPTESTEPQTQPTTPTESTEPEATEPSTTPTESTTPATDPTESTAPAVDPTESTAPAVDPTESTAGATDPTETPSEPEGTIILPTGTVPTWSTATPTTEAPADDDPEAPKDDYRWIVWTVLGIGAVGSVAVVAIQTKRKK